MKPLTVLALAAALSAPACLMTVDDDGLEWHSWDEFEDLVGEMSQRAEALAKSKEFGDRLSQANQELVEARKQISERTEAERKAQRQKEELATLFQERTRELQRASVAIQEAFETQLASVLANAATQPPMPADPASRNG